MDDGSINMVGSDHEVQLAIQYEMVFRNDLYVQRLIYKLKHSND